MTTKRLLWFSVALLAAVLSACLSSETQPTPTEEILKPTEHQVEATQPELGDPVIIADGPPCLSPTLGIELVMPSPEWNCEVTNESWLKLTSPLFEVNISNLGRGPFCNPGMDDTCQISPFYKNDTVDLQLYTAEGQPREIFGSAQFSNPQANVWVAITWQDMANHPLTESEITEIQRLVSSLQLLDR